MFNKSQFVQSIIRAKYQLEEQTDNQFQSSSAYKSVFENQNSNLFKSIVKQPGQIEQIGKNNENGSGQKNQMQSILENKGMSLVQSTYIIQNKGNIHNYIQFLQEKVEEKEHQLVLCIIDGRYKFRKIGISFRSRSVIFRTSLITREVSRANLFLRFWFVSLLGC